MHTKPASLYGLISFICNSFGLSFSGYDTVMNPFLVKHKMGLEKKESEQSKVLHLHKKVDCCVRQYGPVSIERVICVNPLYLVYLYSMYMIVLYSSVVHIKALRYMSHIF